MEAVWRGAGELCYLRPAADQRAGEARRVEVVLRREGKDDVLSRTWPDDLMKSLVRD
jgi:hypothetical protein